MSSKCACGTKTHFSVRIKQPKIIMRSTSNDQLFEDEKTYCFRLKLEL